jgi:hypothetical protein
MCCLDTALGGKCFSGLACKNTSATFITVAEPVKEENNWKCQTASDCPMANACCLNTVGDLSYCFTGVACDNVTSSVVEPIKEENNWDCNSTYGCPL